MDKEFSEWLELQIPELLSLLGSPVSAPSAFSLSIVELIDIAPKTAHRLLEEPSILVPMLQQALVEAQSKLLGVLPPDRRPTGASIKKYPSIHLHSLPPTPRLCKPTLSALGKDDHDRLLQLSGTVVKTASVKMLEQSRVYKCQKPSCGQKFKVSVDPEQGNTLEVPLCCPCITAVGEPCGSKSLREVEGTKECIDYQEIRLQDRIETLPFGSIPRSLTVILERDLVDKLNPGDDVVIVGVLFRQWRPVRPGARCEAGLAFRALGLKTLNNYNSFKLFKSIAECRLGMDDFWGQYRGRELVGRDLLLAAICPQLYGLYFVKLALLLTVLGGAATRKKEGLQSRANSHMLLIGDPGTGKSQLLNFVSTLTPRTIQTTGVGTTGAGLTCTAIRTGSDWTLDAGALVLANGGVCCIDEFTSMREGDRATIHEAMEQQTISVAKAGLLVKLDTKTTIIAACNPKGTFDPSLDLTANTTIGPALLSRFDLVLVLLDTANKEWDKKMSTYLLKQAVGGEDEAKRDGGVAAAGLPVQFLREYVLYAREQLHPAMTPEAESLLTRYYQMQRQGDAKSSSRTTVRLLESLLRLAEAHAKLMCRTSVTMQDAVMAICCVEQSQATTQVSLLSGRSTMLQSEFPEDPEQLYKEMESELFRRLHLSAADVNKMKSDARRAEENMSAPPPAVRASYTQILPMKRAAPIEEMEERVVEEKVVEAHNIFTNIVKNNTLDNVSELEEW